MNYSYDGTRISNGVSNGLDYNQIIFTNKNGEQRILNIGNVTIIEKKKTVIGEGDDGFPEKIDGSYYKFFGNETIVKKLYVFLAESGRFEWSLNQYEISRQGVYSRIATSYRTKAEYINGTMSNHEEFKRDEFGDFLHISNIVKWSFSHSHPIGEVSPSNLDFTNQREV